MSYTPNTWATGDTITAEKLNNMEQGIAGAGGVLVATMTYPESTFNKTWQEIYDAMADGRAVFAKVVMDNEYQTGISFSPVIAAISASGSYLIVVLAMGNSGVDVQSAIAATADSYPVLQS